jgi:hypothetical protein
LFRVAFICCWCWGSTAGVLSVSSQAFLMPFTYWWTFSHGGACIPKPSFSDL